MEVCATKDIILPSFFSVREGNEEADLSPIFMLDQKGQSIQADSLNGIKKMLLFCFSRESEPLKWIVINQNVTISTQTPSKELQLSIVYIKGLEFLHRGLVITGVSMALLFVTSIKGDIPFVTGIPATAAMLSTFLAFVIERIRLVNR